MDSAGNSKLKIPEGFVYLDTKGTDKFLEMNENLSSGREVMVAPESLDWSAYLAFDDEGYVKDDETIDAAELLKTLKDGAESSNSERRKRGWPEMHVLDWAVKPEYARNTRRGWTSAAARAASLRPGSQFLHPDPRTARIAESGG